VRARELCKGLIKVTHPLKIRIFDFSEGSLNASIMRNRFERKIKVLGFARMMRAVRGVESIVDLRERILMGKFE
jgi:hypothetical protein